MSFDNIGLYCKLLMTDNLITKPLRSNLKIITNDMFIKSEFELTTILKITFLMFKVCRLFQLQLLTGVLLKLSF